jgi:hypothetical protein
VPYLLMPVMKLHGSRPQHGQKEQVSALCAVGADVHRRSERRQQVAAAGVMVAVRRVSTRAARERLRAAQGGIPRAAAVARLRRARLAGKCHLLVRRGLHFRIQPLAETVVRPRVQAPRGVVAEHALGAPNHALRFEDRSDDEVR